MCFTREASFVLTVCGSMLRQMKIKMNKTNLKNKAKELLLCDDNTIEEHEIEDMKAMYYRNTVRGGGAIIISESGEMLFVNPFFC